MLRDQVTLNLRDCIHGNGYDDQNGCSAQIERNGHAIKQVFRNQADDDQIKPADQRQTRQRVVDEFRALLARPDARENPAIFFQIIRGFLGIEND